MRMLQPICGWLCGCTMTDYILNDAFRRVFDVESISEKIKEGRLRWYVHVKRRRTSASV